MKNAYMIMAHHHFQQLGLLVELLDGRDNDIYIHIDSKAGAVDMDEIRRRARVSAVTFVPRQSVTWGGESQIWCELSLLGEALARHHDYYHLLSGDDLPIKSNAYIDYFLCSRAGTEFVGIGQWGAKSEVPASLLDRVRYRYPWQDRLGRKRSVVARACTSLQRLARCDRLRGFDGLLGKGPNWFSITESFASYVYEREKEIRQIFAETRNCDEVFLQTVLLNSPFSKNLNYRDNDNEMALRFVKWTQGSDSPAILSSRDFGALASSDCLFARKFDLETDPGVADRLRGMLGFSGGQSRVSDGAVSVIDCG